MVLIVPPLPSGEIVVTPRSRAATSATASTTESKWSMRLVAACDGIVDSNNVIGTDSRASDSYDKLDVEKPPVVDRYVDLSLIHSDWVGQASRYATDYRSGIGTGKTWDFTVNTDKPNKDVTLTWPDAVAVPKKYDLLLEDVDSGNKVYMRTRAAYTFNSGSTPAPRRFKMTVEPAGSGRLLLTNINVSRTKGSTIGISYTVSRDARVEVRLRDANNRLVRSLGGNTTRAAGLNTVHWDGTLNDGRRVTTGLYLAEVVATGTDGEVDKTIRPIMMGR
jgi:hypothetical protein